MLAVMELVCHRAPSGTYQILLCEDRVPHGRIRWSVARARDPDGHIHMVRMSFADWCWRNGYASAGPPGSVRLFPGGA